MNLNEEIFDADINLHATMYKLVNGSKHFDKEDFIKSFLEAFLRMDRNENEITINSIQINEFGENKVEENTTPFREITKMLEELYDKKNHDYGNSFEEQLEEDGLIVSKIALKNKINRISSLLNSKAQIKTESIVDSYIDLACYTIMTLIWLSKKQ